MSLTSNYLDHLDGRLEKQGGRGSVARLLLVARMGEAAGDSDAVVRYHERVRKPNAGTGIVVLCASSMVTPESYHLAITTYTQMCSIFFVLSLSRFYDL